MIPTSFDESDAVLSKPNDMIDCEPLSIMRGDMEGVGPVVISCWKITREELDEFNRTGRIWVCIPGVTQPPIALSARKAQFFGEAEHESP